VSATAPVRTVSKVPRVTALFWVAKLLTTGMGETTWDALEIGLGASIAVAVAGGLFVVAMAVQFLVPRYDPWAYWAAVVMVGVFGTTIADLVHTDAGVPYTVSTGVLVVLVGACFALWYRVEGTLSIHAITTRRREVFYWSAVLLTFALGTAAGDWTASTLHLGYLPSGLLFAALFALPALAHRLLRADAVLTFWLCYVLTRPLGASFADWFGGPPQRGGLALGMDRVSVVLALVILVVVARFARSGRDRPGGADGVGG
jgi:uncharacterized membrane-anchored protein